MQRSTESKLLLCMTSLSLLGATLSLGLYLQLWRSTQAAQQAAARLGPGLEQVRPDPGNLLPILTGLSRRLDQLEARGPAGAAGQGGAAGAEGAAAGAGATAGARPGARDEAPPRLVSFLAPRSGISVTQTEGGGISVENHDPSLTGQMMLVKAEAEDGSAHQLAIVVPPPAQ